MSRIRYLQRKHFVCYQCETRTWANELAPLVRQQLCPNCYRRWLKEQRQ